MLQCSARPRVWLRCIIRLLQQSNNFPVDLELKLLPRLLPLHNTELLWKNNSICILLIFLSFFAAFDYSCTSISFNMYKIFDGSFHCVLLRIFPMKHLCSGVACVVRLRILDCSHHQKLSKQQ